MVLKYGKKSQVGQKLLATWDCKILVHADPCIFHNEPIEVPKQQKNTGHDEVSQTLKLMGRVIRSLGHGYQLPHKIDLGPTIFFLKKGAIGFHRTFVFLIYQGRSCLQS